MLVRITNDVSDPTPEEISALQEKAGKVEALEAQIREMVPKSELERTAEAVRKELEPQINPNWSKARQVIASLQKIAKDKGVVVNDDGEVVSNPQGVNVEELLKKAQEQGALGARNELLGGHVGKYLSKFDTDSQAIVKRQYDKLTAGESVTLDNVDQFLAQAEESARVILGSKLSVTKKAIQFGGGSGPRVREGSVDSAKVQGLAAAMGIKIKGDEQ